MSQASKSSHWRTTFRRWQRQNNRRGLSFEALESRQLLAVDFVVHISVDGLGGPYLQPLIDGEAASGAGGYANYLRFTTEGAFTFNARTDFTHTLTLPNHASMLTGRPVLVPDGAAADVSHHWTSNTDPALTETLHSNHPDVEYLASVFDVVHDEGLTTALYATKTKFSLFTTSYDEEHGAPDTNSTGGDNGRNKIDIALVDSNIDLVMDQLVTDIANHNQANYTFFHSLIPDAIGHTYGWGTATWNEWIKRTDYDLGRIISAIESSPEMNGRTAIILTTDHGGTALNHLTPTVEEHYTIPFFVWGPGISAGQDLYDLYSQTTADPGTGRPDYNVALQPIRNGDSGNLALELLGLPNIPGSTIDRLTTCEGDECNPDPPIVIEDPPKVLTVTVNGGEDTPNRLDSIAFTFSKDVSASLSADDLSLTNYPSEGFQYPPPPKSAGQAEWQLSSFALPPGFYQVTLHAAGIADADGNLLDGNGDQVPGDSWQRQFVVAAVGDVNADGVVDTLDYNRIHGAPKFGTWSRGDLDGNGTIDGRDMSLWRAARFSDLRPRPTSSGRTPRSAIMDTAVVTPGTALISRERAWQNGLDDVTNRIALDFAGSPAALEASSIDWIFGREIWKPELPRHSQRRTEHHDCQSGVAMEYEFDCRVNVATSF